MHDVVEGSAVRLADRCQRAVGATEGDEIGADAVVGEPEDAAGEVLVVDGGVSRPDNGETTCDMGAYEFNDLPDKDLGLDNMPTNSTVNATSPQGAHGGRRGQSGALGYLPPTPEPVSRDVDDR